MFHLSDIFLALAEKLVSPCLVLRVIDIASGIAAGSGGPREPRADPDGAAVLANRLQGGEGDRGRFAHSRNVDGFEDDRGEKGTSKDGGGESEIARGEDPENGTNEKSVLFIGCTKRSSVVQKHVGSISLRSFLKFV